MENYKKTRFNRLSLKTKAVVSTALAVIAGQRGFAAVTTQVLPVRLDNTSRGILKNKLLKPKLTLKLNPVDPGRSKLAYHSSHSSHSSHASHSSHSSHSSGGYSNSSGGNGGMGVLLVGGAVAYGIYRVTRKNKDDKK